MGLGVVLSALPVAAVTAIEWALAVLCLDRIRGFRSSFHAGRVTNRTIATAGILGITAVGLALLALNIELILQLGDVRANRALGRD